MPVEDARQRSLSDLRRRQVVKRATVVQACPVAVGGVVAGARRDGVEAAVSMTTSSRGHRRRLIPASCRTGRRQMSGPTGVSSDGASRAATAADSLRPSTQPDCCNDGRMARTIPLTGVAQLAIVLSGAVVGMESLAIARSSRGFSPVSYPTASAALELAAGWALLLAGVLALRSVGRRAFGALLCAAGLAWFSTDWNNPEVRSSVLFTGGLVLSTVCPVLVAHAALRNAAPRLHQLESVLLVTAYGSTVLVSGLVPAMLFDPARQGCNACPGNLLALRSDPVALDNVTRAATITGIGWTCALIIAMTVRLSRSSPSRRGIVASVSVPAAVYLAAVGLDYWHSTKRGFLSDDAMDHRLNLVESAALIALALGTGWPVLRRRLTRAAVARLVVEAAGTPPVGGLERALGETLGDPSLRILYPLSDGRLANSSGHMSPLRRPGSP